MSFYEKLLQLERLARLIEKERTGCSRNIAMRLNVSPRTVKNLLDQLRNMGNGIEVLYCRKRNTFYFSPAASTDFDLLKKKSK